MVIDGAMGTTVQQYKFSEEDFRGAGWVGLGLGIAFGFELGLGLGLGFGLELGLGLGLGFGFELGLGF